MERTDHQLVHAYIEGEENAFKEITDRHLQSVYSFAFRLCGSVDEASDITQEVFLKVWKHIKKFDFKYSFKTWLFTIARNTTFDYLRKKKDVVFSKIDNEESESFAHTIADQEPLPDEIFHRKEIAELVNKTLETLSVDYKTVVLLHHKEGLTFEEIGEVVGKSVNTVKSQYRRALLQLRQELMSAPKANPESY